MSARRRPPAVLVADWARPAWARRTVDAVGVGLRHVLPGVRVQAASPRAQVEAVAVVVDKVTTSGSMVVVSRSAPVIELGGITLSPANARRLAAVLVELCDAVDHPAAGVAVDEGQEVDEGQAVDDHGAEDAGPAMPDDAPGPAGDPWESFPSVPAS